MKNCFIDNIAYFLPIKYSVEEMASYLGFNEYHKKKFKLNEIDNFYSADDLSIEEMIYPSIDITLKATKGEEIDGLFYFHTLQTSLNLEPNSITSSIIKKYGIKNIQIANNIAHMNCVSSFGAIQVAKSLIGNNPNINKILISGSDKVHDIKSRFIETEMCQSDGSSSFIVSNKAKGYRILDIYFMIHPRYNEGVLGDKALSLEFDKVFYLIVIKSIKGALEKNNMTFEDINYIIPYNNSANVWREVANRLNISIEKFFLDNISRMGHLFGSDCFINLKDMNDKQMLKSGNKLLLFNLGFGGYSGIIILEKC